MTGAGALLLPGQGRAQETDALDSAKLASLLTGLGYEHKDIGSAELPYYEFTTDVDGYKVFLGVSLSASQKYVWLVTSFGPWKEGHSGKALLERNGKIQPAQFYVDASSNLKLAMAIENSRISPARLRAEIASHAKAVKDTQDVWAP